MPPEHTELPVEADVADRDHDWIAIVSAAIVMVFLGAIAVMGFGNILIVMAWVAVVVALVGIVPVALWRFTDRQ